MITRLLFPHRFRLIGWLVFIPAALLGLFNMYADYVSDWPYIRIAANWLDRSLGTEGMADEIAGIGIIIGLMLIAFSKERMEDEMSSQLRLEALQWSVYANYIVLAMAILVVYGDAFFNVMVYNMFTLLLVFIARYRWLIWQNNAALSA